MANTLPANMAFVPQTFADYVQGAIYKKSNFLNSGAVVASNVVLPQYGLTVTLPEFDALSGADAVKIATAPAIDNLTGSAQVAPILNRVKKFGSNDLTQYLTGADPFGDLANQFAGYWAQKMDEVAVASILGAAQGTGIASTRYSDISAGVGAAGIISASAIIDARASMGEWAENLQFMVVHPKVLAVLEKQNLVDQIPNSEGTRTFPFYGGLRILVSTTAGLDVDGTDFNTLLVGQGALIYADGTPANHVLEMDRVIGFADEVASSRRYVLHPAGAKFVGTPAAIGGSSNVELATAANWALGTNINAFKATVLRTRVA